MPAGCPWAEPCWILRKVKRSRNAGLHGSWHKLARDGWCLPPWLEKVLLSTSLKFPPLYFCPCPVALLKIEKFSYSREYFSIYMYYYQKQKINKWCTKKIACLIKDEDYVSMWNLKISLGVLFYALKMFERPYKTCILHQSLHSFCLSFSTPIKTKNKKQANKKTKQKKHQARWGEVLWLVKNM